LPTDNVLSETQALIKLIPAYNAALAANTDTVYDDMPVADQAAIDAAIAASKKFADAYNGLAVSRVIVVNGQ
jgi:hypothetical protein